ncbi:MAG: Gfo/Idh/MocA family oxidoreductase [Cyanobacteria bacterium P01_H01_bin.121]
MTKGVAVIGTGFGQAVHIPGFQAHPDTQVVAVYHRDRVRAEAVAKAHAIPHASDRLDDILSLSAVDIVSVATPPFLHFEMAKAVLKAGKHLVLEKPTTLTVAEAIALDQLAKTHYCQAIVDFEYRFVPAWQYVAELLHSGYVGHPYLIKIDWLMASRANPERPWNWYSQQQQGGGVLGALGSHTFDYIHWLFGPVQRLNAHLRTLIKQRPDPNTGMLKPVDADDTCLITLELATGSPCQIALSSVSRCGRGHWLEVYGDRGTIVLGSSNQKDYVHGFKVWAAPAGSELVEQPIPGRLEFPKTYTDGRLAPFLRLVSHCISCIDRQKASAPSLREGVYSQLLMDLSQQASQIQGWVDVPELDTLLR